MGNDELTLKIPMQEDEATKIWEEVGRLGSPVSLRKVTRALVILWSQGEIELSKAEVLSITPDGRTERKRKRGQRK